MSRTADRVNLDADTRFALLEKDADDLEADVRFIKRGIMAILGVAFASFSTYIFELLTARAANGG